MFQHGWQRSTIIAVAFVISGCHSIQCKGRETDKRIAVSAEMLSGSIEVAPDAGFQIRFPEIEKFIKTHGRAGWYCGLRDKRSLDDAIAHSDGTGLQQEQKYDVPLRVCDVFYLYFSQSTTFKGLPALKRYHDCVERDRLIKEALTCLDSR